MALAMLRAACASLALLASASAMTIGRQQQPDCESCRRASERDAAVVQDSSWDPPTDFAKYQEASREGGMTDDDSARLLSAIEAAGKERGSFLVTVTDGGMLGMAQNMLRSLDAIPCQAPRLVIGLGANLCHAFKDFNATTCVEVMKDGPTAEDQVAWGTHEYWQVVFRKHVVLTMVAMSQVSRHVVYTDPDIVYLSCPVSYLVHQYRNSHDIVFSPNNMLDPKATEIEDVAETYATRGMEHLLIGPHQRRADINTGLFFMSSGPKVSDLMMRTMMIFKDQEFVHGHYQQFSLVKALSEVPGLRIGVAAGDKLVNGNVFWGHRELLKMDGIVSVHANWMQADLKIPCMKKAGLWVEGASEGRLSVENHMSGLPAKMDDRYATVQACTYDPNTAPVTASTTNDPNAAPAATSSASRPPSPIRPGCHLWLPTGCKAHTFNAQDSWRWMGASSGKDACQEGARALYNKWCGVADAETLFVESPDKPQAQAASPEPPVPTDAGCYAFFPTGCKEHPLSRSDIWIRDQYGEQSEGAKADRSACEVSRKAKIEAWCGVSNVKMVFV